MGLLIDSNVLIEVERSHRLLSELITDGEDDPKISSITAAEILFGVYRADSPERRQFREHFVSEVFSLFGVVPFDLSAARIHAEIRAQLTSTGLLIGSHDLIIAATALANDCAVLTDNVREFSRVPGLQVREPGW
jgi:predicted nucleic acid-binding protein